MRFEHAEDSTEERDVGGCHVSTRVHPPTTHTYTEGTRATPLSYIHTLQGTLHIQTRAPLSLTGPGLTLHNPLLSERTQYKRGQHTYVGMGNHGDRS